MTERPSVQSSDAQLIHEIEVRVGALSSTLRPADLTLARTLLSVLNDFDKLVDVDASLSTPRDGSFLPHVQEQSMTPGAEQPTGGNPFDMLSRQVSDLQHERSVSTPVSGTLSPMHKVQSALLWSNIEQDLETVLDLCAARHPPPGLDSGAHHLPPDYDYDYEEGEDELPPEYEGSIHYRSDTKKSAMTDSSESRLSGDHASSEKMRMDLEAVTGAIDRLYAVCPQLHNQRVELRSDKRMQLEQARMSGSIASSSRVSVMRTVLS
jgi:ubiquitin-protein ligase E3 D